MGEDGLAGLQAVASGPRSAVPGPRLSGIAVTRDAVGMSGTVMLGELGGLAQSVGGKLCDCMGKRWVHGGGQ